MQVLYDTPTVLSDQTGRIELWSSRVHALAAGMMKLLSFPSLQSSLNNHETSFCFWVLPYIICSHDTFILIRISFESSFMLRLRCLSCCLLMSSLLVGMFRLWIALVTTSWWPPCWTVCLCVPSLVSLVFLSVPFVLFCFVFISSLLLCVLFSASLCLLQFSLHDASHFTLPSISRFCSSVLSWSMIEERAAPSVWRLGEELSESFCLLFLHSHGPLFSFLARWYFFIKSRDCAATAVMDRARKQSHSPLRCHHHHDRSLQCWGSKHCHIAFVLVFLSSLLCQSHLLIRFLIVCLFVILPCIFVLLALTYLFFLKSLFLFLCHVPLLFVHTSFSPALSCLSSLLIHVSSFFHGPVSLGAAVMDAALLLIAGNESCPQPQTSEHLAAVEIMKLKNIIILQNKIDLVKPTEAAAQYEEIRTFVQGLFVDWLSWMNDRSCFLACLPDPCFSFLFSCYSVCLWYRHTFVLAVSFRSCCIVALGSLLFFCLLLLLLLFLLCFVLLSYYRNSRRWRSYHPHQCATQIQYRCCVWISM